MIKQSSQSEVWSHFSHFDGNDGNFPQDAGISPVSNMSIHERLSAWLASEYGCTSVKNEKIVDFDEILNSNQVWGNAVLNWGSPKHVKWQKSALHNACFSSLNLEENEEPVNTLTETEPDDCHDDEKELQKLMDLHLLVMDYDDSVGVKVAEYEPVEEPHGCFQTAEEVIEEIEEILLTADEQDAAFDDQLEQQTGIWISDETSRDIGYELHKPSILTFCDDDNEKSKTLKSMSVLDLNEELNKLEVTVKHLSECLLKELNMRDEFLYEKEVRSTFISKILDVQSKQDEFHQKTKSPTGFSKLGKLTKSLSMSNASVSSEPGRFLTTSIPVDNRGEPSMEGLHAMIKLLDAMKEDSNEVPSLIANYILKVLYPAPAANSTLNL